MSTHRRSIRGIVLATILSGALVGILAAMARAEVYVTGTSHTKKGVTRITGTVHGSEPIRPDRDGRCPDGGEPMADLGISGLQFEGTMRVQENGPNEFQFHSEPVVDNVDPRGPVRDVLRPGDVLVAINGKLITTEAGGKLYSYPPLNRPVELTVRRGGRTLTVSVVPEVVCPGGRDLGGLVPVAPLVPEAPEAPEVSAAPEAPEPPEALSGSRLRGLLEDSLGGSGASWLGIGLRCEEISISGSDTDGREVTFGQPPEIVSVDEGSPAARAGLRRGDRLMAIGERPSTSANGLKPLFSAKEGETLTLTVERLGRMREVTVVREASAPERGTAYTTGRSAAYAVGSAGGRSTGYRTRYSGELGRTRIEVRSPERTVVSVEEETNEIVIDAGGAIVRVWIPEGKSD